MKWRRLAIVALSLGLCVSLAGDASRLPTPSIAVAQPVRVEQVETTYRNPVLATDAPDPGVVRFDNTWYMTTTGANASGAFPIWRSTDLVKWQSTGAIFAHGHGPAWAARDFWAPEIHRVGDGYVAYYTARDHSGMLRIGAATAPTPAGPFQDIGHPLVSNPDVGVIDPTFFRDDDGKQYALWKEDGNDIGVQCRLLISRVSADGTSLVGEPVVVLTNDPKTWEGTVVEAPQMVREGGWYYLFYSGNGFYNDRYAEGVARARTPMGPFEKLGRPILKSSHYWKGPGHAFITQDARGQDWLVYHAWPRDGIGGPGGRQVLIDELEWKNGWPHVEGSQPSSGLRAAPTTR